MKRLKLGIIGLGIGRYYLDALRQLREAEAVAARAELAAHGPDQADVALCARQDIPLGHAAVRRQGPQFWK